jgi:hypothetical protein
MTEKLRRFGDELMFNRLTLVCLLMWCLRSHPFSAKTKKVDVDANLFNLRRMQSESRINQIAGLLSASDCRSMDSREVKKLNSMLRSGDPYDASHFSPEHAIFKEQHNDIFAILAGYCSSNTDPCVFYLDGADGGTTRFLRHAGFKTQQLYSANLFGDTVEALRNDPTISLRHITSGRAEEALAGCFAHVQFAAIYLDGCGGVTRPIIAAVNAALEASFKQRLKKEVGSPLEIVPLPQLAIGFTLTNAEPTGRALSDREQDVVRAVVAAAKRAGYEGPAAVRHVGDDPERYGINPMTCKREQGTLTTWLIIGDQTGS